MARPRSAAASLGCDLQAGAGIFKHRLTVRPRIRPATSNHRWRRFDIGDWQWRGRKGQGFGRVAERAGDRASTGPSAPFEPDSGAFLTWVCHGGWNRLPVSIVSPLTRVFVFGEGVLGINSESDKAANLVIGPTSLGMVRIYVEAEGIELPMDFEPGEALEIADELRAAAEQGRGSAAASKRPNRKPEGERGPKRGAKPAARHSTKHDGGGGQS